MYLLHSCRSVWCRRLFFTRALAEALSPHLPQACALLMDDCHALAPKSFGRTTSTCPCGCASIGACARKRRATTAPCSDTKRSDLEDDHDTDGPSASPLTAHTRIGELPWVSFVHCEIHSAALLQCCSVRHLDTVCSLLLFTRSSGHTARNVHYSYSQCNQDTQLVSGVETCRN